jgi:hypothetical protein
MAVGTTARKPDGLQVAFLDIRHDAAGTGIASASNGAQYLIGTIPKGAMVHAVYKKTAEAPTGGARQLWIGSLASKSSLIGAAGITEGTSTTVQVPTALKSVNFTQDTDLYITQTGMTTTRPTAGVFDITIAYVVSPQFTITPP